MLTEKVIVNKIYLYSGVLHKVQKVQKNKNRALIKNLLTSEEVFIPIEQSNLLVQRIYTIGEVSKIVERRPDTIRKYEKKGLIPKSLELNDEYPSYKNWRFYNAESVYEMVEFFSNRIPGRNPNPKKTDSLVNDKIKNLSQKVKLAKFTFPVQQKVD